MFNRDELLMMYNSVDGEVLKKKLEVMLFVDTTLVALLENAFIDDTLVRIEKSKDSNTYYLHFIGEDTEVTDRISKSLDIGDYRSVYGEATKLSSYLMPCIDVIEHDSISSMWWRKNEIQVYVHDDVLSYWGE